jgi:hypothetical protein
MRISNTAGPSGNLCRQLSAGERPTAWLTYLLCSLLLAAGCVPPIPSNLTVTVDPALIVPEEWKQYGAYYEIDEAVLVSRRVPGTSAFMGSYTVHRRLKVLTPEGARHATIPLPVTRFDPERLQAIVTKPDGRRITLPSADLLKGLRESGKVVVPQMEAGAVCDVIVVYDRSTPPLEHEHWFVKDIPVLLGRFQTDISNSIRYGGTTYARHLIRASVDHDGVLKGTWTVRALTPPREDTYMPPVLMETPRVAIAYRELPGPAYTREKATWASVAELALKQRAAMIDGGARFDVRSHAQRLVAGAQGELARAQAIASWVQDHVSVGFGTSADDIAEVVRGGQASFWQAALVCELMLQDAGIPAHLLMTRPRMLGGFDPEFVTTSSLMAPLVIATINGRELAICPYFVAYPVGEYPEEYLGLHGLDLKSKSVRAVPPPLSRRNTILRRVTADLSSDTARHTCRVSYFGNVACERRRLFRVRDEEKTGEYVRSLLSNLGDNNEYLSHSTVNVSTLDEPFTVSIQFRNPALLLQVGEQTVCRLDQLVADCVPGVDAGRTVDVWVETETQYVDEVELCPPKGFSLEVVSRMPNLNNDLFSVQCMHTNHAGTHTLKREVLLSRGMHSIGVVKQLIPQLDEARGFAQSTAMLVEEAR